MGTLQPCPRGGFSGCAGRLERWGIVRHSSRQDSTSQTIRGRILDATLETIKTEGIVGASARAIARQGDFNQASIYYHFGSINDAVIAAVQAMSAERLSRYEHRLATVKSLPELVSVASELHREDVDSGTILVLSQVMAGAAGDEAFGKEVAAVFEPWTSVVTASLERALAGNPVTSLLPIGDLAYAVCALFVGIELLGQLRPGEGGPGPSVFTAIEGIARLVDVLLQLAPKLSPVAWAEVSES